MCPVFLNQEMIMRIIRDVLVLTAAMVAGAIACAADEDKPHIVILATGGTIAGSAESQTQAGYTSGQVGVEVLTAGDRLPQAFHNLLDNAEKYTRSQTQRRVEIAVNDAGDRIEVTVADNGPGVPPSIRRSLFKPFRRPAGDDAPAGLGLGLALARSLARAQGGDLVLAESQGSGARFRLTLPTAD